MSISLPEMVLAFDFSLDRLDVALRGPTLEWTWGHRAYANNWAGYQQLKQDLLDELQRASPVRLTLLHALREALHSTAQVVKY